MDWSPLAISLKVSVAATILSIVVGIPAAYLLAKRGRNGGSLAEGLVILPLVMPPTVLGYFLLVSFGRLSWIGKGFESIFHQPIVFTWEGAALAASIASMPLLVVQSRVAFETVAAEIIDSARVFGASELQIFFRILLPLSLRGVAAGITLAFARAMGDFGATLMVAGSIPGKTRTMPLAIYDALQTGDDKTLVTFVVIGSVITLIFCLMASKISSGMR